MPYKDPDARREYNKRWHASRPKVPKQPKEPFGELNAEKLRSIIGYDECTGEFCWLTSGRGRNLNKPIGDLGEYLRITINRQKYLAHRLAWLYVYGEWPSEDIDHKNRIKTDNRIENLRLATKSQNACNKVASSLNKSGLKGVSTQAGRNKKYIATIYEMGKQTTLGAFYTPEEAHAAYVEAANERFGEFARAS